MALAAMLVGSLAGLLAAILSALFLGAGWLAALTIYALGGAAVAAILLVRANATPSAPADSGETPAACYDPALAERSRR